MLKMKPSVQHSHQYHCCCSNRRGSETTVNTRSFNFFSLHNSDQKIEAQHTLMDAKTGVPR